jgi:hypothetical protein
MPTRQSAPTPTGLLNPSGQLFGRINIIDFTGLALALIIALGIILVQSGFYRTSGQVIKGEGDINYTIYIRNMKTLQPDLFKPGKKLSITIRNQPRGAVEIVKVQSNPKRTSFMLPDGNLKSVADPADPNGYDYLVTLKDHAMFTDDGYVTEGIKVKIGLNIEVEGKNFRVPGAIIDVAEADASGKTAGTAAEAPQPAKTAHSK